MAQVILTRTEATEGDLPAVCMCCGRRADRYEVQRYKWRPWWGRIGGVTPGPAAQLLGVMSSRGVNAMLPFCPDHGSKRLRPSSITNDEITFDDVDGAFARALDNFRQRPKRRRQQESKRSEPDLVEFELVEPGNHEPRRRRADRELDVVDARPAPRSYGGCFMFVALMAAIIVVTVAIVLFAGMGSMMLALIGLHRAPAPARIERPADQPIVNVAPPRQDAAAFLVMPAAGFPADIPWGGLLHQFPPPPLFDPLARDLADLRSPSPFTVRDAAKRLAAIPPLEDRRAEVSRAVEPLLDKIQPPFVREAGIQALAVWGDGESVLAIIRVLQTDPFPNNRNAAMKALAARRDARAAVPLAKLLTHPFDGNQAREALVQIGPAAEPELLPLLADANAKLRAEVCRVLAAIGTPASLPALRVASTDADVSVAQAARIAQAAIEARQK